jgi:hypothetical protein
MAYQAERVQVESYFFHVTCMRCAKCGPSRHLGSEYGLAANAEGVVCLYCAEHELDARQNFPQPTHENGEGLAKPADVVAELRAAGSRQQQPPQEQGPAAPAPTSAPSAEAAPPSARVPPPPAANVLPLEPPAAVMNASPRAGLGTAEDRALEEAIKRPAEAPADSAPAEANPFARCLQCF